MDALKLYKLPILSHLYVRPAEASVVNSKSVLRSLGACSLLKFNESNTTLKDSNGSYFVECTLDVKVGDDLLSFAASFDIEALIELPASCIESATTPEKWFGARITSSTKAVVIGTECTSHTLDSKLACWTYSFVAKSLQLARSTQVEKAEQLCSSLPVDVVAALSGVARCVFEPTVVHDAGVVKTGSVLLCGPSGSGGKTLVQCIARQFDAHLLSVSTAAFYAGATTGATREWAEKQVRELVLSGLSLRRCVLLLGDLHLLASAAPVRSTDAKLTEAEEGIAEALGLAISELEELQGRTGLAESSSSGGIQLLVVGYAHDEQQVHLSARESFRDNVHIPLPSAKERRRIMRTAWEESHPQAEYPAYKLDALADSSTGLAVIPLLHSCRDAVRALSSDSVLSVAAGSGVSFARVAGLEAVKRTLQETVLWPRRHAQLYRAFSAASAVGGGASEDNNTTVGLCAGILLFGPPGTGKTLLPRTLAEELGCSLVNLRISDVVRGEIGTSEKRVVQLFLEAKRCAPSVLFIDEFQALFTSRSGDGEGGGGDSGGSSLTVTLSGCFDDLNVWNRHAGAESLVTVIASTNEPWAVDPGFLRPGRLDKCVFVGPLDETGRLEFLTKRLPCDDCSGGDVSAELEREHKLMLARAAAATEGFTGADLTLLLARVEDARAARCASATAGIPTCAAAEASVESGQATGAGEQTPLLQVCQSDFDHALRHTLASTCADDILDYKEWLDQYPYLL